MPAVLNLLNCFVPIKEQEVTPVLYSFSALFTILTSYFLLLPLREDAGISLGTSTLPLLFACSLLVTLIVTPAVTAYINSKGHAHGRDAALRHFYRAMAVILLGFFMLYNFSMVEGWMDRSGLSQQQQQQQKHHAHGSSSSSSSSSHTAHPLDTLLHHRQQPLQQEQEQQHGEHGSAQMVHPWDTSLHHPQHDQEQQQQEEDRRHLLQHPSVQAEQQRQQQPGARHLRQLLQSRPFAGTQHTSDAVTDRTATNAADAAASKLDSNRNSGNGGGSSSDRQHGSTVSTRAGDAALTKHQRRLRAAFYVWVNVMNLVGISSLWAKCADAFSPDAGARLFGFISAGATLGQLAGSLIAMLASWMAGSMSTTVQGNSDGFSSSSTSSQGQVGSSDSSSGGSSGSGRAVPASSLLLVAAVLQLAAAQLVTRIRPVAGAAAAPAALTAKLAHGSSGSGILPDRPMSPKLVRRTGSSGPLGAVFYAANGGTLSSCRTGTANGSTDGNKAGRVDTSFQLHKVLTGFELIWRSPYLLLVCSNLLLTYVVGSLMYFQRALVVSAAAAVHGPTFRTSFFAALNTWSAAAILLMQLFATSSLLRWLGMSAALGLAPAICLASLLGVVSCPLPWMVAVSEVCRKVFGYALLRPAREVLFTVVSREEKYSAKLVIDTVIQRLGDALAAAVFQVLDVQYDFGQAGVGAAGCLMCLVWLATALALGKKHKQLANSGAALKT